MKRLVTLVLLALVAFRMVGYVVLSLVQIGAQQAEFVRASGVGEVVVFKFSKRDFFQKNNAPRKREFWHDGRLFDIQHIENEGDTLKITASADDIERHLIAGLSAFFRAGHRPANSPPPTHWLAQILAQPFLPGEAPALSLQPAGGYSQAFFSLLKIPLSAKPDILSPPPEAARPV